MKDTQEDSAASTGHLTRSALERGPGLSPPVQGGKNLIKRAKGTGARSSSTAAGRSAWEYGRKEKPQGVRPRNHLLRRSHQLTSCFSFPASGNADEWPAGIPVIQTCRSGRKLQDHLEVYVLYPAAGRVSCTGPVNGGAPPWIGFQWLFLRKHGASNQFESAALSAATAGWPTQSPIPFPAHRHPL